MFFLLLLLLLLLPKAGYAQDHCQQYADETDAVLEQLKELSKQYDTDKRIISEAEAGTLTSELQVLGKRGEEARKKWRNCMGWPSPDEEQADSQK